jgi:hypothetical protein
MTRGPLSATHLTDRTPEEIRRLAGARGYEPHGPTPKVISGSSETPSPSCRGYESIKDTSIRSRGRPTTTHARRFRMLTVTTIPVPRSATRPPETSISRSDDREAHMNVEQTGNVDDDVRVWLDTGGGITIKAVTPEGDPVELSSAQARQLAQELIELAAQDDE